MKTLFGMMILAMSFSVIGAPDEASAVTGMETAKGKEMGKKQAPCTGSDGRAPISKPSKTDGPAQKKGSNVIQETKKPN